MTGHVGTLRIAFGGREVGVHSNDAEVLASLTNTFRHMLGTGESTPVEELRVEFGEAGFHASRTTGVPEVRATRRDAVRWARQCVLEAIVSSEPRLLWLHGAAAGWRGGAIVLPGRRGRGKSTLVTALCGRGASFLTDDILPLDPSALTVLPFPRIPEVRRDPGREMAHPWLHETSKNEIPVDDRIETAALPVAAIVLPQATRTGGVGLVPCTPAEAVIEIAEGCWNFAAHGPAAAETLSRLVSSVPVARMRFDSGPDAADALLAWLADTSA